MDQAEINNWARIAVDLEVAGEIDCVLDERARAMAFGQVDSAPSYPLVLSDNLSMAA